MIIDCISDLHGFYPELEGGDLLIVAGDLTSNNTIAGYDKFFDWFSLQPYRKKIYIAGNHDGLLASNKYSTPKYCDCSYLYDSGTEFEGLKIYGSPWTPTFGKWDFMKDRGAPIKEKWDSIPGDTDILITHGPPRGSLDECYDYDTGKIKHAGCEELEKAIERIRPKLVIFGHIHEHGGQAYEIEGILYINASHVDKNYKPVNKPIRVIL